MSFMDMCKPRGPLEVLTPEEQRVTDHYQRSTTAVEERVKAVIADLYLKRVSDEQRVALWAAAGVIVRV